MNKEESIVVLENLILDFRVCRTEREALEFALDYMKGENKEVKGDAIIFSNVMADAIKCYAQHNEEDPLEIYQAIGMSFKKEEHNGDKDKVEDFSEE